MGNPLVSIVIPCYNHEKFVQDCIKSIINQTYQSIELIIIDDGSQDNSVKKIKEMMPQCEQRFVRFEFRNRPNEGLSRTLNEALEWCEGKYYSAIASDDMMLPNKTQVQVDFLGKNTNDIVAVFAGVTLIDDNNNFIGEWLEEERIYTFEQIFMHEHNLPAPTAMIRLDIIKKVGGYKQDLLIEDWYMWLKISELGTIHYMSIILCLYRQHDNNISKNLEKIGQGRIEVLKNFHNKEHYKKAMSNVLYINIREGMKINSLKGVQKLILFVMQNTSFSWRKLLNILKLGR